MNLKEAFRFQNKLNELITKSAEILRNEGNTMRVTNTVMKNRVDKDAENEVTREAYRFSLFDLEGKVTILSDFLMYLFEEKRKLSFMIEKAKSDLDIDIDAETSLNTKRQEIMSVFSNMVALPLQRDCYLEGGNRVPLQCRG